jgi:branched-subunit amino acid transport protein
MVVEFENSLDDVLALNLYHYEQSPGARRTRRLLQFGPPAILVAIFLGQLLFTGASPISSLPWLMFAVVWAVFVPYMLRRSMRKRVMQLFVQGQSKGIVGNHTLTLTSKGVTDKTGFGKTETIWRDIWKVVATNQYVFIYLSDTAAHIVPRRAFPDELKFEEFRDTVIRYYRPSTE